MKKVLIIISVLLLFIVGLTLPFHYTLKNEIKTDPLTGKTYRVDGGIAIFPKESLTFKDTFIGNETIQREIKRYNNANYFQRQAIEAEYLHSKLIEYGLIWKE